MDESIGAYLKRQREMRKVRLEEIAATTKISMRCLAALEADDFEKLPSAAFVRGFVRAYAQTIGLNSEEVSLAFEAHLKTLNEGGVVANPPRVWRPVKLYAPKPWIYFLILFGAIFLAVLISLR